MNKTDEQLVRDAKKAFDQSVDGLDAATLSRLNRGRQAALAEDHLGGHPIALAWCLPRGLLREPRRDDAQRPDRAR